MNKMTINFLFFLRLSQGPLLKEIIDHMTDKAYGVSSSDRKMYVYSGHADTVLGLLRTLGDTDCFVPPYASAILVELHRNASEFYQVQVWYLIPERSILTSV